MEDDKGKQFKTIIVYTREQAIDDGVLVDITSTSEVKESGFQVPV